MRLSISSLIFFDLLIRHLFVDVCEFGLCNLRFLFMMVFVCLEVVVFSMMFACWDFVEPIRYGVCDVYVGCGLVYCGWFLHLLVGTRFHYLNLGVCSKFLSCYVPNNLSQQKMKATNSLNYFLI